MPYYAQFVLSVFLSISIFSISCYGGPRQVVDYDQANNVLCTVYNNSQCYWENPALWTLHAIPQPGDSVSIYSTEPIYIHVTNSSLQLNQILLEGSSTLVVSKSTLTIQTDIQLTNNASILLDQSSISADSIFTVDAASLYGSGASQITANVQGTSTSSFELQNCSYSGDIRISYITLNNTVFSSSSSLYMNQKGLGFLDSTKDLNMSVTTGVQAQLQINTPRYNGLITLGQSSVVSGNIPGRINLAVQGASAHFATSSDNITINLMDGPAYAPLLSFPSASNVIINGPGDAALSLYANVVVTLSNITLVDVHQANPNIDIILTFINGLDVTNANFNFSGRIVAMDDTPAYLSNTNLSVYNKGRVAMQFNDLYINGSALLSDSPIIMENIMISNTVMAAPYIFGNFIQLAGLTTFSNSTVSIDDLYVSADLIQLEGTMEVESTLTLERVNGEFPQVLITVVEIGSTIVIEGINTVADLNAYPDSSALLMVTPSLNAKNGGKYPSLHMNVAMNSDINAYDFSLDYDDSSFGLYLKWVAKASPTSAPTPPTPHKSNHGWIAAPVLISVAIVAGVAYYFLYYRKRQGYSSVSTV